MKIQIRKLLSIVLLTGGVGTISLASPPHTEYCTSEGRQAWRGGDSNAGKAIDQMSCSPFTCKV